MDQFHFIYACLLSVFILEILLSFFLYTFILQIDAKCFKVYETLVLEEETKVFDRVKRSDTISDNSVTQHVEFYNPNLKSELEEKEKTSYSSNSTTDNPWRWLNTYSRIPVS